jgi:hypothetical protein
MAAKSKEDESLVTFRRKCIPYANLPSWHKSKKLLPELHVSSEGTIEDDGFGMIQVKLAQISFDSSSLFS